MNTLTVKPNCTLSVSSANVTFNPTTMMNSTSNLLSSVYENNSTDCTSDYNVKIESIKKDLLNQTSPTDAASALNIDLKLQRNKEYLNDIVTIAYSLPKLIDYSQTKPIIPEFDEIQVLKTDSGEIKKFIRKVNYEMIGYHCNHKVMNEQCEKIYKNMTDLYTSNEFKQYKDFMDLLARIVWNITDRDRMNKVFKDVEIIPTKTEVEKIINIIVSLNGKISETNAKTNPECSKCKAAVRKYDYSIREIERMREELREQNEIDEEIANKPDEAKYDFKEFMKRNYPTIDKFQLKDVKDKYKKEFKQNKTYAELTEMVNETKLFTVKNVHGTYYVNRI